MDKSTIWPTIHAERKALAADLEGLTEAQWSTPSLCEGWTVRDVLAHMTATAKKTPFNFVPGIVASGFSLKKLQAKDIAAINASGDTLAAFKQVLDRSSAPPGPADTWLGEALLHSADIRHPLGIEHDYSAEAAVRVADSYKKTDLVIGAKSRIAGLRLVATDADWTEGSGPEVAGPMMSLLMAMSGRKASLGDLSGDGVATLSARP